MIGFDYGQRHRVELEARPACWRACAQVEVSVRGEPDARTGFIVDFGELEQACAEVRRALDHRVLNDLEGLEKPSLESLCAWIWRQLTPRFPSLARVTVRRDSSGQSCAYAGPEGR